MVCGVNDDVKTLSLWFIYYLLYLVINKWYEYKVMGGGEVFAGQ